MNPLSDTIGLQLLVASPIILMVAISVFTVAIMDIRARRRAEYKNHELNAILSSMGEGLIVVTTDNKINIINQAAGVLLRSSPLELVGKKITLALEIKCLKKGKNISLDSILNEVSTNHDVLTFTRKDGLAYKRHTGTFVPIRLVASPFFYKAELHGVVLLIQEVEAA